jgi:hypothetical protein
MPRSRLRWKMKDRQRAYDVLVDERDMTDERC